MNNGERYKDGLRAGVLIAVALIVAAMVCWCVGAGCGYAIRGLAL